MIQASRSQQTLRQLKNAAHRPTVLKRLFSLSASLSQPAQHTPPHTLSALSVHLDSCASFLPLQSCSHGSDGTRQNESTRQRRAQSVDQAKHAPTLPCCLLHSMPPNDSLLTSSAFLLLIVCVRCRGEEWRRGKYAVVSTRDRRRVVTIPTRQRSHGQHADCTAGRVGVCGAARIGRNADCTRRTVSLVAHSALPLALHRTLPRQRIRLASHRRRRRARRRLHLHHLFVRPTQLSAHAAHGAV